MNFLNSFQTLSVGNASCFEWNRLEASLEAVNHPHDATKPHNIHLRDEEKSETRFLAIALVGKA